MSPILYRNLDYFLLGFIAACPLLLASSFLLLLRHARPALPRLPPSSLSSRDAPTPLSWNYPSPASAPL